MLLSSDDRGSIFTKNYEYSFKNSCWLKRHFNKDENNLFDLKKVVLKVNAIQSFRRRVQPCVLINLMSYKTTSRLQLMCDVIAIFKYLFIDFSCRPMFEKCSCVRNTSQNTTF